MCNQLFDFFVFKICFANSSSLFRIIEITRTTFQHFFFFYMPLTKEITRRLSSWLCVLQGWKRERLKQANRSWSHIQKCFQRSGVVGVNKLLHVITSYSQDPPLSAGFWLTRLLQVSFCWVSPLPATRESPLEWSFSRILNNRAETRHWQWTSIFPLRTRP